MPKLRQPATLEKLAIQCLVHTVAQKSVEAIVDINHTRALRDYLYGELPDVLSQEVSDHMLAVVPGTLTNGDYIKTTRILLAITSPRIRVLVLRNASRYAVTALSCHIGMFQKLHTLIVKNYFMEDDIAKPVADGLTSLGHLVNFQMPYICTDAVLQALGRPWCCLTIEHIHVNCSEEVTDASFNSLPFCYKLKNFSIFKTSVTAEGFVRFLQDRVCDDIEEGFLGLGVGSDRRRGGDVSSRYLDAIALWCPMLKQLEICGLDLNMLALFRLTKLEALKVHDGEFDECNFDSFLRMRGCNITSLTLYYVGSVDLACIVNHCVNIRRLFVKGCSTKVMGILKTAPKPCQYLETLHLSCGFCPSLIEGVFYACINLTSLFLDPNSEHITDELIMRVLSRNPLQKLTTFRASCHYLTMRAVDAIIEQCPLLEELQCFNCDQMTEAEVKVLRQKIKNGNLDLRTEFSAKHFPW